MKKDQAKALRTCRAVHAQCVKAHCATVKQLRKVIAENEKLRMTLQMSRNLGGC